MSSEMEVTMPTTEKNTPSEEEDIVVVVKETRRKYVKRVLREHWQIAFKIAEILLSIACICFAYEPTQMTGLGKSHLHHVGIMYTAYAGNLLINGVLLVSRFVGDRLPYRTSVVFSVSGAAMFLVTAILLITDRSYLTRNRIFHPKAYLLEMLTISTICALVNVVIFISDAIITFRSRKSL